MAERRRFFNLKHTITGTAAATAAAAAAAAVTAAAAAATAAPPAQGHTRCDWKGYRQDGVFVRVIRSECQGCVYVRSWRPLMQHHCLVELVDQVQRRTAMVATRHGLPYTGTPPTAKLGLACVTWHETAGEAPDTATLSEKHGTSRLMNTRYMINL